MQSTEFPALRFVQPAAYGKGRDGRKVMYAVVHYTAGSEGRASAENGAAYDARRTDGTSTHFFCDQDSTIQCVYTWDRANAAFSKGNRLGVHFELCGTVQSRAQWLDTASYGTLEQAAGWIAVVCQKYNLPARRLSVAETRAAWDTPNSAGPRGIVGHVDITQAYGQGDHTDPGAAFPWDVLLDMVQDNLNGGSDMAGETADRILADTIQLRTVFHSLIQRLTEGKDDYWSELMNGQQFNDPVLARASLKALREAIDGLHARLDTMSTGGIDPVAFQAALKAALMSPEVQAVLVAAAREGSNLAEDS